MKNLYRLVYTSARKPNCTDEEIEKILNSCKRNNPGKNLTGVLLHSEKRFLQYLEGDKDELQQLYDLIHKDDRHAGVNRRDFTKIEERMFPRWSMSYEDLSKNIIEFNTQLTEKDKALFRELVHGDGVIPNRGVRLIKTFFEIG